MKTKTTYSVFSFPKNSEPIRMVHGASIEDAEAAMMDCNKLNVPAQMMMVVEKMNLWGKVISRQSSQYRVNRAYLNR